jgi:hypothetical protein
MLRIPPLRSRLPRETPNVCHRCDDDSQGVVQRCAGAADGPGTSPMKPCLDPALPFTRWPGRQARCSESSRDGHGPHASPRCLSPRRGLERLAFARRWSPVDEVPEPSGRRFRVRWCFRRGFSREGMVHVALRYHRSSGPILPSVRCLKPPPRILPVCARSPTTTRLSRTVKLCCVCWVPAPGACSTSCVASAAPGVQPACCTRCWVTSGSCSATRTCRTTCSTTPSAAPRWWTPCATAWARCRNAAPRRTTLRAMRWWLSC